MGNFVPSMTGISSELDCSEGWKVESRKNILVLERTNMISGSGSVSICLLRSFSPSSFIIRHSAPEIIEDAQAYPQSDMWSLGVLLYVMLSGQLPFKVGFPNIYFMAILLELLIN